MSRTLSLMLLAAVSLVTFGCGAAREAQKEAASAPTANIAGNWTGNAGTGGVSVPINMTLTQNGTAVSGQISVGGRPDLSGAVKGTVQGRLVNLSLPSVSLGQMTASPDSNTISGEVSGGMPATLRRSR